MVSISNLLGGNIIKATPITVIGLAEVLHIFVTLILLVKLKSGLRFAFPVLTSHVYLLEQCTWCLLIV